MSFKWFTKPTNADNRDFGFSEDPLFDRPLFDRSEPSDAVDILTGTPERDVFVLEPPGYDLDDNFIAFRIPTIVDLSEDSQVDLLVYQEADGPEYFPGFTAPPARSYTYIEDFDLIEDEIIVGGNPYRIEIDDEIIAGESSNEDLFPLKNPGRGGRREPDDFFMRREPDDFFMRRRELTPPTNTPLDDSAFSRLLTFESLIMTDFQISDNDRIIMAGI